MAAAPPSVGPAPGRELKKARPPISRIMRPNSTTSTVGRQVSGNRKPVPEDQMEVDQRDAIARPAILPSHNFNVKKHFDYSTISHELNKKLPPTRFEDMEIYSTILWHLKRETDLAFLAHELIDASWQSPEAWCVLGNSWALARDHEQALKCFKRATQLNPKFAYAFTLQGHEHVANEEYDKALISYRQGMAADKRHYNAWYGVGKVYEKLGNYEKAFAHFSSASLINPTNTILICSIGSILEKQKQHRQASSYFARATEMDPKSHMARYGKARSLMAIGDNKGALKDLMILKDIAPDAAMASPKIKEAIESLEDDDDDELSMMA
ncbi:putative protein bimA [Glarea lozoyensis 74030]|uniref:Uncharacterized protein n=1 Tax=Glarea lozoyensis (strain ATCC 74030 / MF5533) TaxID=1104152 RepID=H0EHE9_GLAL7|nr:putative protein bimA [Glarea lozoyensis 74030]